MLFICGAYMIAVLMRVAVFHQSFTLCLRKMCRHVDCIFIVVVVVVLSFSFQ